MDKLAFQEDLNLLKLPNYYSRMIEFRKEHPYFFNDVGTMIFCGHQGAGKTLSAVNYIYNLWELYPHMIVCSNTSLQDFPFNCYYKVIKDKTHIYRMEDDTEVFLEDYRTGRNDLVECNIEYVCIEYDGLDCLKALNNGELGVLYFIDEIHLELNSLESKNIDIEVMIEISQQRKQRKKIIGTSQIFFRMAKPLREQVFDIVICNNYNIFGAKFQLNKSIDGFTAREENGKLKADIKKRQFYFHTYEMYDRYNTYSKMKRYSDEWQGHNREPIQWITVGGTA